eukprot:CAMPEP_0185037058 /NCGR_PEP_ID=MMETSP1103-20130426/30949_1 /TAXON_ID=36769 /ORGANISM="Paraphysomonas bandaiensis, Strain Caron Lab Isolate" /LENGTH=981 /DNA_ID=CAMNT_0027574859 /DNA_START=536 /DNA_END=3481 /DNA_ORIENTATION=-
MACNPSHHTEKTLFEAQSSHRVLLHGGREWNSQNLEAAFVEGEQLEDSWSDDLTLVVSLPHYDSMDLFEQRHDVVQTIASDTGTNIFLQMKNNEPKVVIRCLDHSSKNQLIAARDRIMQFLHNPHRTPSGGFRSGGITIPECPNDAIDVVDTVMLPKSQYAKLAAVGFAPIQRISHRVGCRYDVAEDFHMGSITFRGSRIQVDESKELLNRELNKRPNSFTGSLFSSDSLYDTNSTDVKRRPHSFNGRTSPFPVLEQDSTFGSSRIHSIRSTPVNSDLTSVCINCEYDSVGRLIGVKGSRITELREITGCRIYVRKGSDASTPCVVEILGMASDVAIAVPCVKMVLSSGDHAMEKVRVMMMQSNSAFGANENGDRHRHAPVRRHTLSCAASSLVSSTSPLPLSSKKCTESLMSEMACQGANLESFRDGTLSVVKTQLEEPASNASSDRLHDDYSIAIPTSAWVHGNGDSDIPKESTYMDHHVVQTATPALSVIYPQYFISSPGKKATESIVCPSDKVTFFRGRLLTEIASQSRCKITLDESPQLHSPMLHLYATKEQRELAKLLLKSSMNLAHTWYPGMDRSDGLDCTMHSIECPPPIISVIIGPGGSTIEDIQAQTGTKILISEYSEEECLSSIYIIGSRTGVDSAAHLLDRILVTQRCQYRQHLANLSSPTRVDSTSPNAYDAKALDEVDSHINEMCPNVVPTYPPSSREAEQTSVNCGHPGALLTENVPQINSNYSATAEAATGVSQCTLMSPNQNDVPAPPGITRTQDTSQLAPRASNATDEPSLGYVESVFTCPMDKVAKIIGRKGTVLREIRKLSECEIIIDQDTKSRSKKSSTGSISDQTDFSPYASSDSSLQVIKIIGTPIQIETARKLISDVIDIGPAVALGMKTVTVECPVDKVPLIIGIKGLTSKEMMRRSGCKIHVNEDTAENLTTCTIELTGTDEQLAQAQKLISHVLEFGTKALGKRFQRALKEPKE